MTIKQSPLILSTLIASLVSIVMIGTGYLMLDTGEIPRIWQAVLFNYLFFTSLSAGLVVWPAVIIISNGKWVGSLEKISLTGISFSLPSIIAFIILWIGSKHWTPWMGMQPQKIWLNNTFLFSRNLVLLVLFWCIAFVFIRNRYKKKNAIYAGLLVATYAITFSFIGFDFVMAIDPKWHSMMMGGYFFMSGLYLSLCGWVFLSIFLEPHLERKTLYDLGKLMLAFCMLTTYLMFSQLLPIWYENMPDETSFLVPRLNLAWRPVSTLLVFIVYVGPVLLLISRWVKENILLMGIISFMILVGMWIERWSLISAVFERNKIIFGRIEVVVTLSFTVVIVIGFFLVARSLNNIIINSLPDERNV